MMTVDQPIRRRADLAGRRALVLGLARSGLAAARFLADAGAVVAAYDRREASDLADAVSALEGRPIHLALGVPVDAARTLLDDAELIVTSPSISARFPTTDPWLRQALSAAEERGAEVVSEVELFLRLTPARIAGITGTKGKTTTTALLGAMLDAAGMAHLVGGNIGRPLIESADALAPDSWAVLELSELQLPTITRGADVAIYTNILADHLDRHGTVEAYRAVKARLAELTVARGGVVVLNDDDPGCRELADRLQRLGGGSSLRRYALEAGSGRGAWQEADHLVVAGERLVNVGDVALPGEHLRRDVLAASLGAHLMGVPREAIGSAVRAFRGVAHRLETVGQRAGVRWVNDSQATIPAAAIAGLEAYAPAEVVLIAGGKDKGLDYRELAEVIVRRCRAVVLIGETAGALERLVAGRVPVRRAEEMDDAVALAASFAHAGDVVLLAPAAASFDMFTDYAARGDAFRRAVQRLAAAEGGPQ